VVRLLAIDIAVRVGALTSIAEVLFELCNLSPWPVLERTKLIINLPEGQLKLHPELAEIVSDRPTITIPLRPVVSQLREQLLAASDVEQQASLRFPPIPVSPSVRMSGGRP
jgi:hypothetical protein